jgi:TRAP-type C4-dicarboxylate transport system permease small subunit
MGALADQPGRHRVWRLLQAWGLRATAAATALAGAAALLTSLASRDGEAPSLGAPFLLAGFALVIASALIYFRLRSDLVEIILGGLAGGSFGITLAEMSAQAQSVPDHYKSLWVPASIAALLVAFLAFKGDSPE